MESAGIHDFPHYRDLVRRDSTEREMLRSLLIVTISRFFREVDPKLAGIHATEDLDQPSWRRGGFP